MAVMVLDKAKKPLMPCSEKRARLLLGRGRATGSFNIQTRGGVIQGIRYKHCRVVHRADGYGYSHQPKIALTGDCGERAA